MTRIQKTACAIEDVTSIKGLLEDGRVVLVMDSENVLSIIVPSSETKWDVAYVCKPQVSALVVANAVEDEFKFTLLKNDLELKSYADITKNRAIMRAFATDVLGGLPWEAVEDKHKILGSRNMHRGMKAFQAAEQVFSPENEETLKDVIERASKMIEVFEAGDEGAIRKIGFMDHLDIPDLKKMQKMAGRYEKWTRNMRKKKEKDDEK